MITTQRCPVTISRSLTLAAMVLCLCPYACCAQFNELSDLEDLRTIFRVGKSRSTNISSQQALDILARSRWRNSIQPAIRRLLISSEASERRLGWQLGELRAFPIRLSEADLKRMLNESNDDVKCAAIRAIAVTDTHSLDKVIQCALEDPASSAACKGTCISVLSRVPIPERRELLWLLGSRDPALHRECISSFAAVCFSRAATAVVRTFLDDVRYVDVALSDHSGLRMQLRTFACVTLEQSVVDREETAFQILQKLMPPNTEHLGFAVTAIRASHVLAPLSDAPISSLNSWLDEVPSKVPEILQLIDGRFADSRTIEVRVCERLTSMPPFHKCRVCKWLTGSRSDVAVSSLRLLTLDSHPGVRVAATVSLAMVDPVVDVSTMREQLLISAINSSDEFMIAFASLNDAVKSLALAGNSDDEAISWLKSPRDPKLRELCDEAITSIRDDLESGGSFGIPWRALSIDGQ